MDYSLIDNIILKTESFFSNSFNIKEKGKNDFVTSVDVAIEDFLVKELSKICPEASFVLEEDVKEFSKTYFVIDPLDGTTNFIYKLPCFGVSVALVIDDELVYGGVYDPNQKMLMSSYENRVFLNGKEYHYNGKPVHLSESLIEFGTNPYIKKNAPKMIDCYKEIFLSARDSRRCGATIVALMNMALGKLDIFMEENLSIWDFLGSYKILKTLGLYCSDLNGNEISLTKIKSGFLCASNKENFEEILAITRKYYE